jgi:hypothetical protein
LTQPGDCVYLVPVNLLLCKLPMKLCMRMLSFLTSSGFGTTRFLKKSFALAVRSYIPTN